MEAVAILDNVVGVGRPHCMIAPSGAVLGSLQCATDAPLILVVHKVYSRFNTVLATWHQFEGSSSRRATQDALRRRMLVLLFQPRPPREGYLHEGEQFPAILPRCLGNLRINEGQTIGQ